MKEERNISFNGISLILDQKNYKSIRTNKILKPHNLDSSYRKGKVRENRIEREFESKIEDLKYYTHLQIFWLNLVSLEYEKITYYIIYSSINL